MPSQRQRSEVARGLSTPSPQKRHRSPGASSRRLAAIEFALSQGGPSSQATQKPLGPSLSQTHPDSLPQFDMGDESEDDFYTTSSSPPRHIADLDGDESPRKKRRLDGDEYGSGGGYMLRTPPRSDGNMARIGMTVAQPESPTKGKGMEMSEWEKIQADQSNPFHERASSLRGAIQSIPCSPQGAPTSTSASTMTPESIKTLMNDFSTVLPAYIAKLERKQGAVEKSDNFKQKRIRELEDENKSYALTHIHNTRY